MEQELAALRRQLEEQTRLREEERRLRQEAEARATAAEEIAEASLPKTLTQYLDACHQLSLAIQTVTDVTLTTQGDTTKPAGRFYPRHIIPWDDFLDQQQKTWDQLSASDSFTSRKAFPSAHQLDYVRQNLNPIASEIGLRHFARDTVEIAVQKLVQEVFQDDGLRQRLGLQGTVTFESHTNLGESQDTSVEEAVGQLSINDDDAAIGSGQRGGLRGRATSNNRQRGSRPASMRPRGRPKGKGGSADQFCIYKLSDGQSKAAVAIEYKPPHKLPLDEVVTGLSKRINPDTEVINQEGDDFAFLSKYLLTAVVTQCFSYMINKGIRNGYLYTGQVIVFLRIPADPEVVYYHVCVPNLDVKDDDEHRYLTAVAQILAFVLRAIAEEPPPQSWHDATTYLDVWAVEYVDILKRIPETKCNKPTPSPYVPSSTKIVNRSRVRTRSQHLPVDHKGPMPYRRDDKDDDPPTPTPAQRPGSRHGVGRSQQTSSRTGGGGTRGKNSSQGKSARVEDAPYCTHKCLLGIMRSSPLDQNCPNFFHHKNRHIKKETFLRRIRLQLFRDRGTNADCQPLYLRGSRGALFKVRLSSHGYTLVAKGMEEDQLAFLRQENRIYNHLSALQGTRIPVCLGTIDLKLPYYYDCGVYVRMLFLSWAGRPLFHHINAPNHGPLADRANDTLRALHERGVLHRDAALRNILYDERADRLMMIDFERARICAAPSRSPLECTSVNRNGCRRKGEGMEMAKAEGERGDEFAREMNALGFHLARAVR